MTSWPLTALRDVTWPALVLLAAWLLTLLTMPFSARKGGARAETQSIIAGVILQAATVVAILLADWSPLQVGGTVAGVLVLSWLAEFVGSHTGFTFGRYSYTRRLQPQLGQVPVLIPFAWLMMLPPAWAIGGAIAGAYQGLAFILASSLAFTAWDLFLDPQMVAWGMWVWQDSERKRGRRRSGYFGIPWSNYVGWAGVSALITWAWSVLMPQETMPREALTFIYALTWGMETFAQLVFWHLPGPALSGALGMGICLLLATHGAPW